MQHYPPYGNRPAADRAGTNQPSAGDSRIRLYGLLGILLGLVCCPVLGVVFSIMSITKANEVGTSRRLGYFGLLASIIGIGLWIYAYTQGMAQKPLE